MKILKSIFLINNRKSLDKCVYLLYILLYTVNIHTNKGGMYMLKQAFYTYVSSFHCRNWKKMEDAHIFFWFYWFTFMPILNGYVETKQEICYLLCTTFPLFFVGIQARLFHVHIPKAMFLCPLKQEERKQYFLYLLWIKIAMPVLFVLFLQIIYWTFIEKSIQAGKAWMEILYVLFIYFSINISTVFANKKELQNTHLKKELCENETKIVDTKEKTISKIVIIEWIALCNQMALLTIPMFGFHPNYRTFGLILMIVLDIIIWKVQYAFTIKGAYCYEKI